jgi:hypothetical protein
MDDWKGNFGHLVNLTGRLRDGWIGEIPVDHFTDHAPIYYAIRIWNNYEKDLNN